ncbi:activator of HSP90 ATPase [Leptospira ryugenii]|uniref:Activator of HSP90 ATPase n=1 Tax=Leptospira ryugenii TaxID=1917863 RepID=A0A2P2E241_9LEPT|nr:SRPBCC family protein [Leptospira ryugenii]GBF50919.1 activator of HSP90 ATPase [Leptospira ryugenii]
MLQEFGIKINPELDLFFERNVEVPPQRVWDAWTRPELLVQWFTPDPWKTTHCEIDLKPGGIFRTVMKSPEGMEMDNIGSFLEVVPQKKLVFTDTLLPEFVPSENPFFTAMVFLEPTATGTRYIALARHGKKENCNQHKEMGFFAGWNKALDQMIAMIQNQR